MKRFYLSIVSGLLPTLAMAAPFDGTWTIDPATVAWVHAVPETYVLTRTQFTCGTGACSPTFTVAADGKSHSIEGHASYDNVAVAVVDPHTVTVIARRGDTMAWKTTYIISGNGRVMTAETVTYEGGKSGSSKLAYSRSSHGANGSHAISGSWLADPKSFALSPALATLRYQETSNGLQMSDPLGDHYDAKFDGHKYLTKGDPAHTLVVIERLGPRTIREMDYVGEKLRAITTMEVVRDGRTMQDVAEDKATGASFKYLLRKKP